MAREGMVAFTVELPLLDMDRLKEIAQAEDLRVAQLVRRAVRDWLDKYLTDQAAYDIDRHTRTRPDVRSDTHRGDIPRESLSMRERLRNVAKTAWPTEGEPEEDKK